MKISNKKIFLIILLLLGVNVRLSAFEKVGTTSFQFLKVYPGARASSMSGAFSTLGNNSEAVFWNPAGLTKVKDYDVSINYIGWLMDIKHYAISAAYNTVDYGSFGFQAIKTDVGEIQETRADFNNVGPLVDGMKNPGLTGAVFSPNSMVLGISYANQLTDRFSYGVTAKFVREDLIYKKASAFVFDGGFLFDTKYRSIVIGASIRHFGSEVKFVDKYYPLPQTFNIGISGYLFSPNDPLISKVDDQSLLISYDIIQPRDYTQMHSLGFEYSFNNMLFLRTGYTFNNDQEGISAGLGVIVNNCRIDYSFSEFGKYLGSVNRISVGFGFN